MFNIVEMKAMNYLKNYFSMSGKILLLLTIALCLSSLMGTATAKSLYLLSDVYAYPTPLQAYDIALNGTLTYQAEYTIPRYNNGANNIALDSESGYLFVTYAAYKRIVIVNSKTMETVSEQVNVSGSYAGLEGIVYNHKKKQLYCVDKGRPKVWVYDWDPNNVKLTPVDGSPFSINYASAYGIALDETKQLLYVANSTNRIYAYSTDDWSQKRTVTLNRVALCVAVDSKNQYLYTGAGYLNNQFLTQYNLKTNELLETAVESTPNIGVMGIAVDPNSSKVYCTTGHDYLPGGDNIHIYDKFLHHISCLEIDGNPTGLVIPNKEVGYNPLNLKKEVVEVTDSDGVTPSDAINAGDIVTYRISFDNIKNENTVTNVEVVDMLPQEVSFVSAFDNGLFGSYDELNHKYTWNYETLVKGSTAYLEIKVKVDDNLAPRTPITNVVTISSDTTPPVTRRAEVLTDSRPLNVTKTILGAIEGMTKWVDLNEILTYDIHIDNNNNNFSANNVIVTDTLPEYLTFISANEGFNGIYDANTHSYTWSISSLEPQESADLSITARLREDAPDGMTVTNIVYVESGETALAKDTAEIRVGNGPVVIPDEKITVTPDSFRRDGALSGVMVVIEMPMGYKPYNIADNRLLLSAIGDSAGGTIKANADQVITESAGKTYVIAVFDKNKLIQAIPGYGLKYCEITGTLADNGLFSGYITLNITRW